MQEVLIICKINKVHACDGLSVVSYGKGNNSKLKTEKHIYGGKKTKHMWINKE